MKVCFVQSSDHYSYITKSRITVSSIIALVPYHLNLNRRHHEILPASVAGIRLATVMVVGVTRHGVGEPSAKTRFPTVVGPTDADAGDIAD